MYLQDFPKTLGLEEGCEKGDFPFLFAKFEHEGGRWDHLPPINYYDVGSMKPERRVEFEKWYAENRRTPFVYDDALIEYCTKDVEVLMKGVLAFREMYLHVTADETKAVKGLCPFYKSFTISACANRLFRTLILEKNTIALLHAEETDRAMQTQSFLALQWLRFLNYTQFHNTNPIQHALNGGNKESLENHVMGFEKMKRERLCMNFMVCIQ